MFAMAGGPSALAESVQLSYDNVHLHPTDKSQFIN